MALLFLYCFILGISHCNGMISSVLDYFHMFHAANITCRSSFLHCKVILEGVAKGSKAAGGDVNLESTEIAREREDW